MKFSATKEKLLEGLQQVQNVVSTRTTLPILSNVLLQAKEGAVHLTTTDLDVGVRGSFEANVDKVGATTLPARRLFTIIRELPSSEIAIEVDGTKAVTELQRLLKDDGEVKISVGSGQMAFDLNNTLLVSKLIEGNYPNYKQVIPSEAKERVTLERETFLNSLRRVSLLASDKSNSIKLNFSKNNIDITANTPEVGEAKESLAVVYKGRDFSIAFNPEFLMAPLRNLSEDEVFFDLIDEMSPGVLKIQTPFLYVLMPMRVSS